MTRRIDSQPGQGGFTLLEVLMALAIFSIGLMAMGALQSSSMMATGDTARKTEAWTALEDHVEMLKAMPFFENDTDDDGDGNPWGSNDECDPWLRDTEDDPDFDHNLNDFSEPLPQDGRYQIHWRVENDVPIAQQDETVLSGVNVGDYTVCKAITVALTRPGEDPQTNALATVDFIKVWGVSNPDHMF